VNQNQQLKNIFDSLRLPSRFMFTEFVNSIQVYVSKEIIFWPWQFPPNITGACLDGDKTIYIFYAEDATPIITILIKIHELIHIIHGNRDTQLHRQEEMILKEMILQTGIHYRSDVNNMIMRSVSSSRLEAEVEEMALAIVSQLLPERSGSTLSLAHINLD